MNVDEDSVRQILDALREDIERPETGRRYAKVLGMAFIAVCALEHRDPSLAISDAFDELTRAREMQ